MAQGVQDNRGFYRIRDKVILSYTPVAETDITNPESEFPISLSPSFELLSELHQLDAEQNQALRTIADKDKDIALCLRNAGRKIELLARAIIQDSDELEDLEPVEVTLSEGGISFTDRKPFAADSLMALKLFLLPSYIGLALYGRVVHSNEHFKGGHLVHLEFEQLNETQRQLLARHVMQYQAKQRREQQTQYEETP